MLATELLMPRHVFSKECGGRNVLTWETIEDLAKQFEPRSLRRQYVHELLGVSVLEIENDAIAWAFGQVRKGPVAKLDEDLRLLIERAKRGDRVNEEIVIHKENGGYGVWRVEGKTIGQGERALLLMIPQARTTERG